MRLSPVLGGAASLALALVMLPVPGAAAPGGVRATGAGSLDKLANIPISGATSIAFIKNVAFVSSADGIFSIDISNPASPQVLGVLPMYIFENEHMTADPKRNLIFIARDPRGFDPAETTANGVSTYFPYGAIHAIDVSNPAVMTEVGLHITPTGHTATCINDCTYLWVGGPRVPAVQTPAVPGLLPAGPDPSWAGRPIWAVNVQDPANMTDCPHWLDLGNNDGVTDYSHDVDVDASGVAWVSGSGHLRGFWTRGQHLNPVSGKVETATACDPIPYAGGGTNEGQINAGGVIHNSGHNLGLSIDGRKGDVLLATEEVTVTDCTQSGRFLSYDIGSSYNGEGWINTDRTHFRLRKLAQWTPQNQPGSADNQANTTGCDSAHWFTDRGDGMIAIGFYTEGLRVLDARDPLHIKQAAVYNPTGNDTVAAYWHGDNYIYVCDTVLGFDVMRFHDAAGTVVFSPSPPPLPPSTGGVAPLPTTSPGPRGGLVFALLAITALCLLTLGVVTRRSAR